MTEKITVFLKRPRPGYIKTHIAAAIVNEKVVEAYDPCFGPRFPDRLKPASIAEIPEMAGKTEQVW